MRFDAGLLTIRTDYAPAINNKERSQLVNFRRVLPRPLLLGQETHSSYRHVVCDVSGWMTWHFISHLCSLITRSSPAEVGFVKLHNSTIDY